MKGETFASWLSSAKEQRGWSLRELERHSGVADGLIARYESGVGEPNWKNFLRLCHALGEAPDPMKLRSTSTHDYWKNRSR